MDPLSGLSLACHIIQLVDSAIRCSKAAADIYNSADGWTRDQERAEHQLTAFEGHVSALHTFQAQVADVLPDDEIRKVSALFLARCHDLRERLECCRAKRRRNVLSTAKAMARYYWSISSDIRELQEGMADVRKQLEFVLLRSNYNGIASLLSTCKNLGHQNTRVVAGLESLEKQFKLANESRNQLSHDECEATLKTARDAARQATVLKALHFPSLDERFRSVRDAHPGTFEWIFQAPDRIREKEPNLAMTMPEWLRSGSGIFHVTGKPGSGKSTFMKFLTLHPQLQRLLEEWAGDKELIFAEFFFWRISADGNQKSLNGLIRGLLYHVLCQAPSLAEALFPQTWETVQGLVKRREGLELSPREVTRALSRLVELSRAEDERHSLQGFRICFFIDGLDEFDESVDGDTHGTLVRTLKTWAHASRGNVKLCVSSRIQEPFIRNFDKTQRITLSNLTKDDIDLLVNSKLGRHERFKSLRTQEPHDCDELIRIITSRAEGVFLWVTLIIGSITRGLDKGDPVCLLIQRTSETPQELNSFFTSIVEQIEPVYREGSFLMLATVLRWTGIPLPDATKPRPIRPYYSRCEWPGLTTVSYFILLRMMDSKRELGKITRLGDLIPLFGEFRGTESAEELKDAVAAVIITRCCGLIDVFEGLFVDFIHRSIAEFLEMYLGSSREELGKPDNHKVTAATAWCYLVEANFFTERIRGSQFLVSIVCETPNEFVWRDLLVHIRGMDSSGDFKGDETTTENDIPTNWGTIIGGRWLKWEFQWKTGNKWFLKILGLVTVEQGWNDVYGHLMHINEILWQVRGPGYGGIEGGGKDFAESISLLARCPEAGFHEFPQWVIQHTNLLDDEDRLHDLIRGFAWRGFARGSFARGGSSWQPRLWDSIFARLQVAVASGTVGPWPTQLWMKFIFWHWDQLDRSKVSNVIESWIRHGADPKISFQFQITTAAVDGSTVDAPTASHSRWRLIVSTEGQGRVWREAFTYDYSGTWMESMPIQVGGPMIRFSLRETIEYANPYNKDRILELIDSKLGKPSTSIIDLDSTTALEDARPVPSEDCEGDEPNSAQSDNFGRHFLTWLMSHGILMTLGGQLYIVACVVLGMGLVYSIY